MRVFAGCTRRSLICSLAATLTAAAFAVDAYGSFPGRNGRLVTTAACSEFEPYLRAYTPTGRSLGRLTRRCPVVGRIRGTGLELVRETSDPDWSADGRRLFYHAFVPGYRLGDKVLRRHSSKLMRAAPDGSRARALSVPPGSPSPDGRHVVYRAEDGIWRAALSGRGRRRLLACAPTCIGLDADPRWSPDGRQIAVSMWAQIGSLSRGVWILDAETGAPLRRLAESGEHVDFSPDGRQLAYRGNYYCCDDVSGEPVVEGGDLYVVATTGDSAPQRLYDSPGLVVQPAWSPDGRSIAFNELRFSGASDVPDARALLRRIPALGGRARTIVALPRPPTDEGNFFEPDLAWQPLR